ncbi:MAG TPA: hypothetical protein VFS39_17600 [Nitrospira sp.]|nr:hypothetical protein [Nitrospira sp.]
MGPSAGVDRYQLAGLDERERGFSRLVECEQAEQGYRAILRYERAVLTTNYHPTQEIALQSLIHSLQMQGYRLLKTQRSFRLGVYLGSQAPWVEYPDPPSEAGKAGWWARFLRWFGPSAF